MPSQDRHITRSGDDYAVALAGLLPRGLAWPRHKTSALMKVVAGLTAMWGRVEQYASLLLERESDPRSTVALLPEWERAFGLPDDCLAEPLTITDRRVALLQRITLLGAQSRAFFIAIALQIGYTITITEYSPFQCGVSMCGDTTAFNPDEPMRNRWEIGRPEIRYYWTVHITQLRLSYFHVSAGQTGIDPLLSIGRATDLECIIRRYRPAHTEVIFDYSTNVDFSKPFNSGYLTLF